MNGLAMSAKRNRCASPPRLVRVAGRLLLALLAALTAGCSSRPALTDAQRAEMLADHAIRSLVLRDEILQTLHDRVALKGAAGESTPTLDVLVLSGGGQYGAFGAGFLEGWGVTEDPALRRPDFDMITGVSTGALIAPFAFLGLDEGFGEITEIYRKPMPGLVKLRGIFFFMPGQISFYDTRRLTAVMEDRFNAERMRAIAARHAEHRLLLVATTDLDLGRMRVWNLGQIAAGDDPDASADRFRQILLASAAMPTIFPPVMLDGALHADGGVTGQLFLAADPDLLASMLHEHADADPPLPMPRVRIWVVVNQQLRIRPDAVESTWMAIGARSVATLANAATISSLRRLEALCDLMRARYGAEFEFRWVDIPSETILPTRFRVFDPELMNRLADAGAALGRSGNAWSTTVPTLEWGFIDPLTHDRSTTTDDDDDDDDDDDTIVP